MIGRAINHSNTWSIARKFYKILTAPGRDTQVKPFGFEMLFGVLSRIWLLLMLRIVSQASLDSFLTSCPSAPSVVFGEFLIRIFLIGTIFRDMVEGLQAFERAQVYLSKIRPSQPKRGKKFRRLKPKFWHRRKERWKRRKKQQPNTNMDDYGSSFSHLENVNISTSVKLELQDSFMRRGLWHYAALYENLCTVNPEAEAVIRNSFRPNVKYDAFCGLSYDALFRSITEISDNLVTSIAEGVPRTQCMYWTNEDYPLIFDTGASTSISPNRSDFVTYETTSTNKTINGIGGNAKVVGKGLVQWTVRDDDGSEHFIRTEAYHVPATKVRLFSTYPYFQRFKERTRMDVSR